MRRRIRTAWRVGQRYRRAADLLTVVGALAGGLAVLLAGWAAAEGAAWLDRDVLVPAGLAAWAGGLGMRLVVRCVWRGHRRLRAEQWA